MQVFLPPTVNSLPPCATCCSKRCVRSGLRTVYCTGHKVQECIMRRIQSSEVHIVQILIIYTKGVHTLSTFVGNRARVQLSPLPHWSLGNLCLKGGIPRQASIITSAVQTIVIPSSILTDLWRVLYSGMVCTHTETHHIGLQVNCASDHLFHTVQGMECFTINRHGLQQSHYTNEPDQGGEPWPGMVKTDSVRTP